jgi:protein transport protein SEC61 subunit gamma-like protein
MGEKLKQYLRILKVAKKPSSKEFKVILKITGLGVLLIGLIGFIIHLVPDLIEILF